MSDTPDPKDLTPAPLRNQVAVELAAPVPEVWALLSDLTRMPEYGSGLDRVEATRDDAGRCTEYVCHFKPMEPGAPPLASREVIRWWEPDRGFASSGADAEAFGLTDDLHIVSLTPIGARTRLDWSVYFDSQAVGDMQEHFDHALTDIAENLVRRFGGRLLERRVVDA